MSEIYQLTYGDILRELRTYHGYKQKDVSDYLNITSQAYSNYERNKRTPDVETMYKIAHFYKISLDQLVSFRNVQQIEEAGGYFSQPALYHGVCDCGISIPLNSKQAKMVTDILTLPPERQDACQKFVNFLKNQIV